MNDIGQRGLALWCDAAGMILQTLRNDLNLAEATPGHSFLRLVDTASRLKAMNFIATIKEAGTAFDCELNTPLENGVTTLHFSGGQNGEQLLIVGAVNNQFAAQLYKDMLDINNEQINQLRAILKNQARVDRDDGLYDEISRLNNELVTMQREMAKKNAELERLNALKNQFLGMAAHDLRNPLYLIMNFSEMLLEDTRAVLSPEQSGYLEKVIGTSKFMNQLVNDFLSVALIESGTFSLNLDVVDFSEIVKHVVALTGIKARDKNIQLVVTQDPALPRVIVDGPKIQQVLTNLVSNAIEHSYPASSVELRATYADPEVIIEIEDHGVGIAEEDLEHLFNQVRKKQSPKTGGEKSTGLGLAISHKIVKAHNGEITVTSAVGQGSTFRVILPTIPPH